MAAENWTQIRGLALMDHDYEVESRGSTTTDSGASEISSSPPPADELIDVISTADEDSPGSGPRVIRRGWGGRLSLSASPEDEPSPLRLLDRRLLGHLHQPSKRRRVNSEPAGELLRLGLCRLGEGRGRKPRAASTQSESDTSGLRDRKKEQNKDAAKRYRQRKKSDRYVLDFELQQEASRNTSLGREIDSLTQQINCLKRCLRDAASGSAKDKTEARDSPLGILAEVASAQKINEEADVVDVVSNDDDLGRAEVKRESACGRQSQAAPFPAALRASLQA